MDINVVIMALIAFLGLAFGSFATAVAYRLPRDISFVTGRSHCPSCKHTLGALDLFPLISWLYLRGKCRYCHQQFGISYLSIEIALSVMFCLVYLRFGLEWQTLLLCFMSLLLIILTVIDFEHYIIPDEINIGLFITGLLYLWVIGAEWQQFVYGPLLGFSIGMALRWGIWLWKRKEGLGLGDVKFLIVVGLLLPPDLIITFLFSAGVIGIVIAVTWKIAGKGERFPFGPALSFSLFVCLVFPEFHVMWQDAVGVIVVNMMSILG